MAYEPVADAFGTATITVKVMDNGGTANSGVDSIEETFDVPVTPVNDVPSFTKGADEGILEDAGAQTVTGWATAISKGPANEASQVLTFNVANNNNALFSAQPAISAAGELTYTAAANANGAAVVTVSLSDDGGTSDGGVDQSADQTFNIVVTAVNDVPTITAIANQAAILEDAGAQNVNFFGVSEGIPADESGQTLAVTSTSDDTNLIPDPTVTYTPDDATGS